VRRMGMEDDIEGFSMVDREGGFSFVFEDLMF
jgi:hypothetical protein